MTIYYVDPADGGSNSGTQDNPYTDLQSAIDAIETATGAPHTVYCKGTQTLTTGGTSVIVLSTVQDGSLADGYIEIIGCNSSWVDDGTLFVLDGADSNSNQGLEGSTQYWKFKNLEVKRMTSSGIYNFQYCIFDNVKSHDNGIDGFRNCYHSIYKKCSASYNSDDGFESNGLFLFCTAYDNGDNGFFGGDVLCIGCLSYDNTGNGISSTPNYSGGIINSVSNNNTGANLRVYSSRAAFAIGCRSTDSDEYGLSGGTTSSFCYENYNFFLNNTSGVVSGQVNRGGDSLESGTEGFTDKSGKDFTLTSSASLRRVAVDIA